MITISKEKKQNYINKVYQEMLLRGYTQDEIPKVISKTGFLEAIEEYPEIQLHYAISDAVDDIIQVASLV